MADPIWVDGSTPLNSANLTKLQTRDEKAAVNGYASLDSGGKIPTAQLPGVELTANKNAPSGYVGLDAASSATIGGFVQAGPTGGLAFKAVVQNATPANDWAYSIKTTADTAVRWGVDGSGKILFGPGGSTAVDTNLYRAAANFLKTDSSFRVGGTVHANQGTGKDVIVGYDGGQAARAIAFINDAQTAWDVTLYRYGPNKLKVGNGVGGAGFLLTDLIGGAAFGAHTLGSYIGYAVPWYRDDGSVAGWLPLYS